MGPKLTQKYVLLIMIPWTRPFSGHKNANALMGRTVWQGFKAASVKRFALEVPLADDGAEAVWTQHYPIPIPYTLSPRNCLSHPDLQYLGIRDMPQGISVLYT